MHSRLFEVKVFFRTISITDLSAYGVARSVAANFIQA